MIDVSSRLGRLGLAQLRINIFNMMAAVCSLLLVVYAWFMFLPMFEGLPQYSDVQVIVTLLSVGFIGVSAFQFYIAIWGRETKSKNQDSNPEEV